MSLTAIDKIFHELGPIPRLCFGTETSLVEHRANLNAALDGLTFSYLKDMASRKYRELDAVSSKMYMLRRSNVDADCVGVDVMAISPFVASKLAARMRTLLQPHELVHLFRRYLAKESTRIMAGDIFEAYCHVIFSTRIEFDFVPMVRVGDQTSIAAEPAAAWSPKWYSRSDFTKFGSLNDSGAPEALHCVNASATNKTSLSIHPSRVIIDYSPDSEVANGIQIESNVYYVPIKSDQVGIDSFILHNNNLYLLQMSVVDDIHPGITNKLFPFLLSLKGLPPRSNWHFIFVKAPGFNILTRPIPDHAELWDLALYLAKVEVKS